MNFTLDPDESVGDRVARIAREAAAEGPMGAYLQGTRYADFLSVWGNEQSLRFVKTSCAVCASAVLGYAGKPLHKPWHADGSWGILNWLGLTFSHPAWTEATPNALPHVGDVFYRGGKASPMGHVGIFVESFPNGLWRTCEGGGSLGTADMAGMTAQQIHATNGTVFRMTPPAGKDIFAPDSLGRHLTGWWRAELIGLPSYDDVVEQLRKDNGG